MIRSISFIILSRPGSKNLDKCKKILEAQNVPDYEVHAGSLPDSNAAAFLNELCAKSTKEYIAILNSDLFPGRDWYAAMREHQSYDLFGCSIRDFKGRRILDWFCQRTINVLPVALPLDYQEWAPDARLSRHFMMFTKKLIQTVHFENSAKISWNESLCLAASKKGFRVGIISESKATLQDPRGFLGLFDRSPDLTQFSYDYHHLVTRAHQFVESGRFSQAARDYAKLLEIHPDSLSLLVQLGWAHFRDKAYRQALNAFEKALSIDASDLSAQRGEAWASFHLENFSAALKSFSSALKLVPASDFGTSQDVCRGLGWTLSRLGRKQEAQEYFKKALDFIGNGNEGQRRDALSGLESCQK